MKRRRVVLAEKTEPRLPVPGTLAWDVLDYMIEEGLPPGSVATQIGVRVGVIDSVTDTLRALGLVVVRADGQDWMPSTRGLVWHGMVSSFVEGVTLTPREALEAARTAATVDALPRARP